MDYGEMLRSTRVQKGITLRELSIKSEIDTAYISRIERGTIKPPQADRILDAINAALELDPANSAEMKTQAAIDNKLFPKDVSKIHGFPLFVKTVSGKKLTAEKLKELTDFINKNY